MKSKTIRVNPVDLKDRIIQINRSKGSIKRFEEYMSNARRFMLYGIEDNTYDGRFV